MLAELEVLQDGWLGLIKLWVRKWKDRSYFEGG
jgi:hypothetical protein